jgi:hypothetical protein
MYAALRPVILTVPLQHPLLCINVFINLTSILLRLSEKSEDTENFCRIAPSCAQCPLTTSTAMTTMR